MEKDKERKKNFLDKLYDWSASIDPLIPKDYQEGVDWWNPHAGSPHGSYQNVTTQGDPLKNMPIKALHEFGKKSSKKFGVWSDEERLLRERIANAIKRKKEMYDKNPEQIHSRNIYSSAYQNGGLIKEAQNVASKGRYGDTMLMHVNPQEVAGLASLIPLTVNPETGQPEAFIGAILGSLLGGAFLPGLAGGTWLTAAGGAALGSGLGTWAETGDLEKGIASAVLGYGVGQIMGDVATAGGEEMIAEGFTQEALQETGNLAAQQEITRQQLRLAAEQGIPLEQITPEMQNQIALLGETASQQAINAGLSPRQLAQVATDTQGSLDFAYQQMSGTERLGSLGKNIFSGDTVEAVADNYLPIALGGGSLAAQNAQDQYLEDMARYRAEKEKRKEEMWAKYPEVIHPRNPYYGYASAEGGQIPSYQDGGETYPTGPEGQFRPPSYYMPGIDSEFNYFPNRVVPASAISAAQAQAGERQEGIVPTDPIRRYQPMTFPDYDYDAVPVGSVLGRVQDAYNAGLPTTTQLLSPYRNVALDSFGTALTEAPAYDPYGTGVNSGESNLTNSTQVYTDADTYYNTDTIYDTTEGKTNTTDSDLTNNPGSTVVDNNDGTSTVVYEDGTSTTVANEPYTDPVTVTSNTDPVTGKELQPGDQGYVDPASDEYSESTYQYGSGGGSHGQNPYLGSDATTYTQVEANRETLRDSAVDAGVYEAYNAAIEAGVSPDRILIGTDPSAVSQIVQDDPDTEEDESSIIVGPTGYGKQGSAQDGTFVYTNTNPALGYVADSTDNYYPGERRVASSGILISPDGTRTQINDLSKFQNPMDGSVIELNNGYSVHNTPELGEISYSGVGMFANNPSYGGQYERDPAVYASNYIYQTKGRTEQADAQAYYQQALADALARGDIPSAAYQELKDKTYEDYLAYLEEQEAAKKAEEEKQKEEEDKDKDKEEDEKDAPAYVKPSTGGSIGMQEGMQVPNMQVPNTGMAQQNLEQEAISAILGQHSNPDAVIQTYIEIFGVDSFLQLRDQVLKQQVPNAQTEGMIEGLGGGMDDNIMGKIGNQSPIAVSPGEYIVPADVVSMLGDGSSDNGSDKLDDMLDRVRTEKTGSTKQAQPLGKKKIMAA